MGAGGLPLGGENWECHRRSSAEEPQHSYVPPSRRCPGPAEWICYGEVIPGTAPPGGCGWTCEHFAFQRADRTIYRCQRPEGPEDLPPWTFPAGDCDCALIGRCAYCERGSVVGGTVCRVGALPPPSAGTPSGRPDCEPGATYWCGGGLLAGWGTVTCGADGSWPTEQRGDRSIIACEHGQLGGRRPRTVCACYHYSFAPQCCERPDCMVPSGSAMQRCPATGGAVCAPCLPVATDTCGPGLVCVFNGQRESFCAARCNGDGCGGGEICSTVASTLGPVEVCLPSSRSCYW
jgi:hypothetical protein